jgi:hypothetical protein
MLRRARAGLTLDCQGRGSTRVTLFGSELVIPQNKKGYRQRLKGR